MKYEALQYKIEGLFELQNSKNQPAQAKAIKISTINKAKVMVVEDDIINQKLIRRFLENLDVDAQIVSSGFEAIDKVKEQRFDIIFMDLQMPEIDGIETTEKILAYFKEVALSPPKIIGLSANILDKDIEQSFRVGMVEYLTKPISTQKLKSVLEKWT